MKSHLKGTHHSSQGSCNRVAERVDLDCQGCFQSWGKVGVVVKALSSEEDLEEFLPSDTLAVQMGDHAEDLRKTKNTGQLLRPSENCNLRGRTSRESHEIQNENFEYLRSGSEASSKFSRRKKETRGIRIEQESRQTTM
ncbi:hypothetical protein Trydic_g8219 [Trypoxylus dichotomus]